MSGPARFRQQRWLIDDTIRNQTIEFDQPRLGYHLGPVGDDHTAADMAMLRAGIRKLADHVPACRAAAIRRETRAQAADDAGHPLTASSHWFAAAQLWSMACWPVWEDDDLAHELDHRKNTAYERWAKHADHRVERVDIPYGDRSLPAWWHRPPGDGPFPTVVACGGMDAPRDMLSPRVGDPWIARGVALLAVDGPGRGEAAIHGVHITPTAWQDAGVAIVAWLSSQPDVDMDRLGCSGTSFGSFFMTQVAATQAVFKGCSVALPAFEPGAVTIFEEAAPTFKARHMWMAGLYDDEPAFDRMVADYDLRPLLPDMTVPWQVIGGGADELSPAHWVPALAATTGGPSSITTYAGARHSMTESLAVGAGPSWRMLGIDWLYDRIMGHAASDENLLVRPDGQVVAIPHPR